MRLNCSLVSRSSPSPVFDHLQYAKMDRSILHTASNQKLELGKAWE